MDLRVHIFKGEAGSERWDFRKAVGYKWEDMRGSTGIVAETAAVFWAGVTC